MSYFRPDDADRLFFWVVEVALRVVIGCALLALGLILLAACGAGRHGLELWTHPPNLKAKPERVTPCLQAGRAFDPQTLQCVDRRAPDVAP